MLLRITFEKPISNIRNYIT